LTVKDYDIEVVKSVKYLGTEINHAHDETVEIEVRILASIKAYS
jgi:hypothetical protein